VRVAALCDTNKEHLDKAAAVVAEDRPKLFENYREMLDFKDLDAVFIATPCYLHPEMAIAVLASGRHCYCEKPMALTLADVDAVRAAAAKARGIFQIGTQTRYGGPWGASIKFINSGKPGKPVLIRCSRHNGSDFPQKDWFLDPARSGDVMLEQAVHEFDRWNAMFQGIPVRAASFGGQALRKSIAPMHDHFTLCLDYGTNKQAGYTHSWLAAPNVSGDGMKEFVYCMDGTVDVFGAKFYHREAKIEKTPAKGDTPAEMTNLEVMEYVKGDTTEAAVNTFFQCCRKGEKPMANADTGRDAVLVGLLCRTALAKGEVVTMKEILAGA
jgi:predicted dehydrogenase